MEKQITVNYGALGDKIEIQLNNQGLTLGDKVKFIHELHHSLNYCMFHLLTPSQHQSCLKKLHKKVMGYAKILEEVES